ncbi:MAG: insulinase family protein [Gemmatimonadota bacterium]|nr:insulinase family protein [Gemmatimonadota bacterium]MDH3478164.1 insulinase family protein [Gemmatimonadota bacterium]MDH3569875.1 insulinase family protein [Gemmatimonadota bacterium]MDH5549345.1 insulinase family protein [Gemmatimonadota bacterium]
MRSRLPNAFRLAGLTLLLAAAAILGPPVAHAQFPTEPPPGGELRPLPFPEVQQVKLRNGLTLLVVENRRLPILSIRLSMRAGSREDPKGMEGLASMVGELMTKGTPRRTADQVAAEIEGVGGSLSAAAGADFFSVFTTVLSENAEMAFDLMSDVLLNATYPEDELELARTRTLSALQVEKSSPGSLAGRYFQQALYGDHPYGRQPTEESTKDLTREAVRNWAGAHLGPEGSLLVLAGDITLADGRRLAEQYLGNWRGKAPTVRYASPPPPRPTAITLVHRPGSSQSNILVGNLATRPIGDGTYYAVEVANKVLGGGVDARLFMILREQKSWTYGAYSGVPTRKDGGYFQASAEVRTTVTDSALVELMGQIRRIRTEAIPDSEMAAAKGYLVGSYPLDIQTPQQIASQVASAILLDRGIDFVRTYGQKVDAVTPTQAMAAARRVFRPDSAVVVVVGDGQALYDKLRAIAPVTVIDVEGKPLAAENLTPKATALALNLDQVVSRRDSFAMVVQGNAMGSVVTETVRDGDDVIISELVSLAVMGMRQESRATLAVGPIVMKTVDQTMDLRGQKAETHLVYAGGRVSGTAQTPQPTGEIETAEIDTEVLAGVLDDNVVQGLLPAFPLAEGAEFTVNVFRGGEGSVAPLTFKVAAVEDVTVPAGTFSVFRIEMTGGQQPATFYVTRDTPRRVVKMVPAGQPVSLELVK